MLAMPHWRAICLWRENYVIRRLVEPYVMQRATRRIAPRDVERAAGLNHQMAEAARQNQSRSVWELNHQFHQIFFERCGIPSLTKALKSFWPAFPMFQSLPGRALASVAEHEAILDAVRAGP
jgi:DNA-binding GntR family transcriptional regulator